MTWDSVVIEEIVKEAARSMSWAVVPTPADIDVLAAKVGAEVGERTEAIEDAAYQRGIDAAQSM